MDLLNILKLLYDHRGRIQARCDAIAAGNEETEPNYLYYLRGILDQTDVEIEVFETVIKANAETMLKSDELLSRIRERGAFRK